MAENPKKLMEDSFWPLGGLSYSQEIRDFFPEEAEMIGVITIIWNRQELALRSIFLNILEPRDKGFGEAIWDRQPTHHAKRELLAISLESSTMSDQAKAVLTYIIDKTKIMADRRNELIHAEYVVHNRTDKLHAKVKLPRSAKGAKYQKLSVEDLQKIIDDLDELLGISEWNAFEFLGPEARKDWDELCEFVESLRKQAQNPQTD
jgi:hypothetical protein